MSARARLVKDFSGDDAEGKAHRYPAGSEGNILCGPYTARGKEFLGVVFDDGEAWFCEVGTEVVQLP